MSTLRLITLALKYHWDAQRSNPVNLFAAVFGMILNNVIVLWGLWAMLFDGKSDSQAMTVYFLALNGMLVIAWGSVCFFLGGLHSLGTYIDEGSLEPMLSTPRSPLLLAGISDSLTPALGDVLQGLLNIIALFFIASPDQALRCFGLTFVCGLAVIGLFIFTGSLPFFLKRGSGLSQLLREVCLSLSFYPTGKIFGGSGRVLLFITPAAVIGLLPMKAVEDGAWDSIAISAVAALAWLWISIKVFSFGLKRYQTASYVAARE